MKIRALLATLVIAFGGLAIAPAAAAQEIERPEVTAFYTFPIVDPTLPPAALNGGEQTLRTVWIGHSITDALFTEITAGYPCGVGIAV